MPKGSVAATAGDSRELLQAERTLDERMRRVRETTAYNLLVQYMSGEYFRYSPQIAVAGEGSVGLRELLHDSLGSAMHAASKSHIFEGTGYLHKLLSAEKYPAFSIKVFMELLEQDRRIFPQPVIMQDVFAQSYGKMLENVIEINSDKPVFKKFTGR